MPTLAHTSQNPRSLIASTAFTVLGLLFSKVFLKKERREGVSLHFLGVQNQKRQMRALLSFALFFGAFAPLEAGDVLLLDDTTVVYSLQAYLKGCADAENRLTIDDFQTLEGLSHFLPLTKEYQNTLYQKPAQVYWLRFTLKNNFPTAENFLLLIKDADHAELYSPVGAGYTKQEDGITHPYLSRNLTIDRSAGFALMFAPYESKTFFVRIENRTSFSQQNKAILKNLTQLSVQHLPLALELSKERRYYQGFYLGAMLLLALYNFSVTFLFKDRRYLYYTGLLLSALFFNLVIEEYLVEFFFRRNPSFNWRLVVPSLSMLWFFYTLFFRRFLNMRENQRTWDYVFIVLGLISLFWFVLSLFGIHHLFWVMVTLLVTMLIALVANLYFVFRLRYSPARFLLVANVVYFAGILVFIAAQLEWIEQTYFNTHASQVGDLLLGLIVSVGLIDRINTLRKEVDLKNEENQKLIREQNERLEMEVAARTREISDINQELRAQQDELLKQSEQLEIVNRELKEQQEAIQKAYQDIAHLSEVGKDIIASLDLGTIIDTVYSHIKEMMDASVFGIATYNADKDQLEFLHFLKNGIRQPYREIPLTSDQLSTWCARNRQVIFINDFEVEYPYFMKNKLQGKLLQDRSSIIYYPLVKEDKLLGVLTIQSTRKDAYTRQDYRILQTMASYLIIALTNNEAYETLQDAKEEISRKNLQITDSLRYARDIQAMILPSRRRLTRLFNQYFVIYKPKDYVSGDFYWAEQVENRKYIAVADCTGHGVPGAFMSMIGSMQLNQSVLRYQDPAAILESLNRGVRRALKQESNSNNDGMDICLCVIEESPENQTNSQSVRLIFAGAKRPLYYFSKGKLGQIKGTRKSIGGVVRRQDVAFEQSELTLDKGDCIYLTTDGYVDQASPKHQKIGTTQFLKWLESIAPQEIEKQEEFLLEKLAQHQLDAEQRDDITLIGIRF